MMLRRRMAGVLAVMALLFAACGDDGGEAVTRDASPGRAETPATAASGSGDSSEADGSEASGSGSGGIGADGSEASGSGSGGIGASSDAGESAAGSGEPDDAGVPDDGEAAADPDAEALLASAVTAVGGRSFRGEATFEFAPGFALSAILDSDAEGDLAAITELPPGLEPGFPGGAEFETRYVGATTYVRPPVPAAVLAELGLEEAWYVDEPAITDDRMAQAMGSAGGAMCVFPGADGEAAEDCDPLAEIDAFLEAARGAEIVGSEDVRGVETTRVRFMVSLLDLMGEALGMVPDGGGTSEDGPFDDAASDPFAEGLDQILGFLDAGFEVEVWIDDGNLIRRVAFDLVSLFTGIAGEDAGAEMPSSPITLEFYDFDADISVDAPPPETIVDEDLLVAGDGYATSEEYEPYDDDYG